jgi:cytochrome c biogenesis protein CcmG/thiol:disulfide interchange protein DsbE
MGRLKAILVFFLAVMPLASAYSAEQAGVGSMALDFTLPYLMDGAKELSLGNHYGNGKERKKTIILSFFGSWCHECKKEFPILEKLWLANRESGLLIVNVCVDKPETADKARKIISNSKVTFPVLHDRLNIVKERYGVRNLPRTFLFDGEGQIIGAYYGFTPAIQKELTLKIEELAGK